MTQTQLDIVIPVFNEIEIVEQLHRRVVAACEQTGLSYGIIYVDDGSSDGTSRWIVENAVTEFADPSLAPILIHPDDCNYVDEQPIANVMLLELSRNFGQPAAILAGLERSQGDCVVIMDGDLQDPPELIPDMVERWQTGDQVVIAERTSREETFLRGLAFKIFHKCFRYLADSNVPPNTGTFCLLDRVAADSICEMSESHRFFPGLRAWVGYRQSMLKFKRPPRAGGEPKQTFVRLLRYARDAVFGFSYKPLRMLIGAGVAICCVSCALAIWFFVKCLVGWETASIGFATLTCAVFGLGGLQLIGMGILGEYIGRIYDEVKARPQYLVAKQTQTGQTQSERNFDHPPVAESFTPAKRVAG